MLLPGVFGSAGAGHHAGAAGLGGRGRRPIGGPRPLSPSLWAAFLTRPVSGEKCAGFLDQGVADGDLAECGRGWRGNAATAVRILRSPAFRRVGPTGEFLGCRGRVCRRRTVPRLPGARRVVGSGRRPSRERAPGAAAVSPPLPFHGGAGIPGERNSGSAKGRERKAQNGPVGAAPGYRTEFQPCRRRITRKAITVSTAVSARTIPLSIHTSGQWCDAGWWSMYWPTTWWLRRQAS